MLWAYQEKSSQWLGEYQYKVILSELKVYSIKHMLDLVVSVNKTPLRYKDP